MEQKQRGTSALGVLIAVLIVLSVLAAIGYYALYISANL